MSKPNNIGQKPIVLMMSYARTGGTVLNRCLASLPKTMMFSEVSVEAICPSSCSTLKEQAKKWYGLDLKSEDFMKNLNELYAYCNENDLRLIIRDWTFGSFVPSRYNNFKPSKTLATFKAMTEAFPVVPFALVRNAVDIWLSMEASPRTFYDKDLTYLYELSSCLKKNKITTYKYEDFCENPSKTIESICKLTGLEYSDSFNNFNSYKKVTGDIDLPEFSRRIENKNIEPVPRRESFNKYSEIIASETKAREINKIFGYNEF